MKSLESTCRLIRPTLQCPGLRPQIGSRDVVVNKFDRVAVIQWINLSPDEDLLRKTSDRMSKHVINSVSIWLSYSNPAAVISAVAETRAGESSR